MFRNIVKLRQGTIEAIQTFTLERVLNNSDTTNIGDYRKLRPAGILDDIVESIWIQHQETAPEVRSASRVLPTGTVEILFHYGDPIAHIENDVLVKMPRFYVTGQRSRPVSVIGTGRHRVIIVSLFPWGLGTLYPGGIEARDGYVDLRLLDRSGRIEKLEEELRLATNRQDRIRLVQRYLLATRCGQPEPAMVAATRILASDGLKRGIRQATRMLEISERHLSRQFRALIGLQPSLYMRIMRFQNALRMRRQTGLCWSAIAFDCGYSDQPHLIREIRRFSGHPPGQLNLKSGTASAAFNGEGGSEFFDTVYA